MEVSCLARQVVSWEGHPDNEATLGIKSLGLPGPELLAPPGELRMSR
jgi:hypothetical protein